MSYFAQYRFDSISDCTAVTTAVSLYYRRIRKSNSVDIELFCSIWIRFHLRVHGNCDLVILVLPTYSDIEFGRYCATLLNIVSFTFSDYAVTCNYNWMAMAAFDLYFFTFWYQIDLIPFSVYFIALIYTGTQANDHS